MFWMEHDGNTFCVFHTVSKFLQKQNNLNWHAVFKVFFTATMHTTIVVSLNLGL